MSRQRWSLHALFERQRITRQRGEKKLIAARVFC